MPFFSTLSHRINTGFTTLANLGTEVGVKMLGYLHLDQPNRVEEDLEMNLLGDNEEADVVETVTTRPIFHVSTMFTNLLTRFNTIVRSIPLASLWPPRRPKFILGLGEITSLFLILFTLIFFVVLGWQPPRFGYVDIYKHNLEQHRGTTSEWLVPDGNHTVINLTDRVYLPTFYTVLDVMPLIDCKGCTTAPNLPSSTVSHEVNVNSRKRSVSTNDALETHHNIQYEGLFHHTYPTHAEGIYTSHQALKIKARLERCTDDLIGRLYGQALELTPGLELALQDCKFAVDFALLMLYPVTTTSHTFTNASLNCSASICGVVPGRKRIEAPQVIQGIHSNNSTGQNEQNHVPDESKKSLCSRNFCDWVSLSNLGRCYHRNETEYSKTGHISYTNDSVDDFKDTAPLECNLCLPTIDREGIDAHCKEVEAAERRTTKYILATLGSLGLVAFVGALVKAGFKRFGEDARGSAISGIPLKEMRVPVLPIAALSSAVPGRGVRLDKRFIGKPVLIPRLAEGVEGAFENPRAAPLPPSK